MRLLRAFAVAEERIVSPTDRHCCVFAEDLLRVAYGADVVDAVPHSRWRIWKGEPPWSPVLAAHEAGIASSFTLPPAVPVPLAGMNLLCQGWRGLPGLGSPGSGHTFIWHAVTSTRGWKIDSNEDRGPKLEGLLSWDDVVDDFAAGVAAAVLRPAPV